VCADDTRDYAFILCTGGTKEQLYSGWGYFLD